MGAFDRGAELQRTYWTHKPEEQSLLEGRGVEQLNWRERLRLHHLICLYRLNADPERTGTTEKCGAIVRRLVAVDSPYRPRLAMIWQRQSSQEREREPDLHGELLNPSLTHLGCLEIYRVDAANQPTGIDFVSFDELSGVMFAPPALIRGAKLFYEDGRTEIVRVPLLYGLTWAIGYEPDRLGQTTRFVAHLEVEMIHGLARLGMGVGQQDFFIRHQSGGRCLFGLGSVAEISFPLDMRDPRFDEKARTRAIDPDEVRRRIS